MLGTPGNIADRRAELADKSTAELEILAKFESAASANDANFFLTQVVAAETLEHRHPSITLEREGEEHHLMIMGIMGRLRDEMRGEKFAVTEREVNILEVVEEYLEYLESTPATEPTPESPPTQWAKFIAREGDKASQALINSDPLAYDEKYLLEIKDAAHALRRSGEFSQAEEQIVSDIVFPLAIKRAKNIAAPAEPIPESSPEFQSILWAKYISKSKESVTSIRHRLRVLDDDEIDSIKEAATALLSSEELSKEEAQKVSGIIDQVIILRINTHQDILEAEQREDEALFKRYDALHTDEERERSAAAERAEVRRKVVGLIFSASLFTGMVMNLSSTVDEEASKKPQIFTHSDGDGVKGTMKLTSNLPYGIKPEDLSGAPMEFKIIKRGLGSVGNGFISYKQAIMPSGLSSKYVETAVEVHQAFADLCGQRCDVTFDGKVGKKSVREVEYTFTFPEREEGTEIPHIPFPKELTGKTDEDKLHGLTIWASDYCIGPACIVRLPVSQIGVTEKGIPASFFDLVKDTADQGYNVSVVSSNSKAVSGRPQYYQSWYAGDRFFPDGSMTDKEFLKHRHNYNKK